MKDEKGNPRDVLVLNKIRIDHDDIPKWGTYTGHGLISEVKPTKTLVFKTLLESAKYPINEQDMGFVPHVHEEKKYIGRGAQVHFARLALWEFQKQHNRYPGLHNEEDAKAVVEIAKAINAKHQAIEAENKKIEEANKPKPPAEGEQPPAQSVPAPPPILTVESLDANVVRQIALYSTVELPGITAFLGGVLAQEVIKKFGKYSPIHQWINVDYLELLSEKVPEDAKPENSRYDYQISVFGKAFQEHNSPYYQ